MSKQVLRVYLLLKITELEKQSAAAPSLDEALKLVGRLELLKEMFEDFNLQEIKTDQYETIAS